MSYHLSPSWAAVVAVAVVWELAWKGMALWKAGRSNQIIWFVVLLVLNTAGILPIVFLLLQRSRRGAMRTSQLP